MDIYIYGGTHGTPSNLLKLNERFDAEMTINYNYKIYKEIWGIII